MSSLRRRLAGIRFRLLAFNVLLVFLPVAGVLFLDTHERQLLANQERSMVEQGQVLAAALSGRGPLREADVHHTLVQLRQRSEARIRVVDPSGRVLADTTRFGPVRRPEPETADAYRAGSDEPWLYRLGSAPFRLYRRFLRPPERPHGSADVYASGGPLLGREVRAALAGRYGAATRISSGGQRSVTLYSAVPVFDAQGPAGAVLVSQSTWRILQALYRLRLDVLRVFLATLAAAVVLSLLVSRTIARPLVRLRNQAEDALDATGHLRGRFEAPERADEIGDLARSLERLRARLEAHIRGVETFASDVSHEFKNPLASIRTASEMLAEVDEPADRKRFAGVVEREVARMEHMLTAVRELSRLDAGAALDERESVELEVLVRGVVEARQLRGGPAVRLAAQPEPLPVCVCPEPVTRALENLIDNAAGFTPPHAAVEVALDREGDEARVRVLDRGPGVRPEHRERIFERFFSDRPDPRARNTHAGLGLPIARAVAESEGGRLNAQDRDGGGAVFELRLPIAPDTPTR